MRFGLLGTLEVVDDRGAPVDVGGSQPRTVLTLLLLGAGQVVPADALIDAIWGDDPPESASGTLQSYISRLRRCLEPHRAPRDAPRVLVWEPPGYRLVVDADDVDFRRFERLADSGRSLLDAGRAADARRTLLEADGLWRGPALRDHLDLEATRGVATRLEERRMAAIEDRIEADLRLGRHSAVVGELTELAARHPLREQVRAHLALALYRSGRQADALRVLDDARRTLRDELGVAPGPALRVLEQQILDHDPQLTPVVAIDAASPLSDPPTVPVEPASPDGSPPATVPTVQGLVGRRNELAQLTAALAETAHGARFALVEGEPGIGKTRLAEAIATTAAQRDAVVVWGRGLEGGAAPAFWPWIAALRSLADATHSEGGPEQLLGPASETAPVATRFQVFESVAHMLREAAAARTVVVVLDDIQWADASSLELLAFLAGHLSTEAVFVLATTRELDVGRNDELVAALAALTRRVDSRRLRLRGLDVGETAELLAGVTGQAVPVPVARAIHDRAEGNPFFATELARLLADDPGAGGAGLDDPSAVTGADVPSGVRDVVRRRLARLPDATHDLLQIGSVIGRDVDVHLLAHVADRSLDECIDTLEPAVVQRLLVMVPESPSLLRFSHALVREVLADGLTGLRRARLHLRIADAIEAAHPGTDDVAEILAEHLWAAAPIGAGQRAAEALERAAEVATRRTSLQIAEDFLTRAVQLRHSAERSPEAIEAEAVATGRLNAVVRARRGFLASASTFRRGQELARAAGRRDILHEMMWVEWGAADTACDFARAQPLARYFRDLAHQSDDNFERLLGHGAWGIQCWHSGQMPEAVEYLDAAARLADLAWSPEHASLRFEAEQRMFVSGFALHVHDLVGDLDDIEARFEDLARRQPDRFSVSMLWTQAAAGASARGDWARAERAARHGLEADPDVGFTFWGSGMQMYLGTALIHAGQIDEGRAVFEEGRRRYHELGTRTALGNYYANAGVALLRHGLVDPAEAVIRDARDELTLRGERWPEPVVLLAEGQLAHTAGDASGATKLLHEAVAVATQQGSHGIARRAEALSEELGLTRLTG